MARALFRVYLALRSAELLDMCWVSFLATGQFLLPLTVALVFATAVAVTVRAVRRLDSRDSQKWHRIQEGMLVCFVPYNAYIVALRYHDLAPDTSAFTRMWFACAIGLLLAQAILAVAGEDIVKWNAMAEEPSSVPQQRS